VPARRQPCRASGAAHSGASARPRPSPVGRGSGSGERFQSSRSSTKPSGAPTGSRRRTLRAINDGVGGEKEDGDENMIGVGGEKGDGDENMIRACSGVAQRGWGSRRRRCGAGAGLPGEVPVRDAAELVRRDVGAVVGQQDLAAWHSAQARSALQPPPPSPPIPY